MIRKMFGSADLCRLHQYHRSGGKPSRRCLRSGASRFSYHSVGNSRSSNDPSVPALDSSCGIAARRHQICNQGWGRCCLVCTAVVSERHTTVLPTIPRGMGTSLVHACVLDDDWCLQYYGLCSIPGDVYWCRLCNRCVGAVGRKSLRFGRFRVVYVCLDGVYHRGARQRSNGTFHYADV